MHEWVAKQDFSIQVMGETACVKGLCGKKGTVKARSEDLSTVCPEAHQT